MESDVLAYNVVRLLAENSLRLVLAESCTSGLIAATLGRVPGVSQYLCGSAVVYREQTKIEWLDVDATQLAKFTAVSAYASTALARNVLSKTSEATIALGITGHLGPDAPAGLDGVVYVDIWQRDHESQKSLTSGRFQLKTESRAERQQEAVGVALNLLCILDG